jgi:hypothetical protein
MRRLLAAIILLLLVLIIPRACQALLGSEDAGPGVDQGLGTPEKAAPAAGVGGDTEDAAEMADRGDNSTGNKAAGTTRDAGNEEAREDTHSRGEADEAGKDLGEILFENLSLVVTEPAKPGGDEALGSADTSVDLPVLTPTDVGDEWQVDRLEWINQRRVQAARREPSGRQPSGDRSAPADRTGASNTVTPVKNPTPRSKNVPASNRAVAPVASIPQPVLEPAPGPVPVRVSAPMANPAQVLVPPRRAVAAPIRRAPLPVVRGIPCRRVGASCATSVAASVAANAPNMTARFGSGVVGARANNAAAFPRAGAVRGAMRR